MNTAGLKIVLDTNILLAIVSRRSPYRWMFDQLIDGSLALCVSNEILLEYREVFERKTNSEVAENVTSFITVHPATQLTEIYFRFNLIAADKDDNKFVDCAIASNADCIVSNDGHFQVLKSVGFPKVPIFTLREFEIEYRK